MPIPMWVALISLVMWFAAVFTAKTGPGLTDATLFPMGYITRATAYGLMLTDIWPPFED